MTIDKTEAGAALSDIARIVADLKQSRVYRTASGLLVMWGALVVVGNLATAAVPQYAVPIWISVNLVGTIASVAASVGWRPPVPGTPQCIHWQFAAAMALLFGFGLLWSVVLSGMGPRERTVFWPTLFMFCYSMAGLWFGRAFVVIGVGITLCAVASYLWAGSWIDVAMAACNGGGLILCGLWMRRA